MYKSLPITFMFFIFLFLSGKIIPQSSNTKFEQISILQGLSNNRVEAIYQDRKGFMWFATEDGLNRYDGYNCVSYGHIQFYTGATIFEDKRGSLWLTRGNGGELFRFDIITEKFIQYRYVGHSAHQIFEDHDNNIWIASWSDGLAKYIPESDTFKIFKNIPDNTNSLPSNSVLSIYEDTRRNFWIGTPDGLFRFDKTTEQFGSWRDKIGNSVLTFLEDTQGFLWIGSNNGLYRMNLENNTVNRYMNKTPLQNDILFLYEDSKDRLWAASHGSISEFNRSTETFINYESYLKTPLVKGITWPLNPILDDKKGTLWIGIHSILTRFNEEKQNFEMVSNDLQESIVNSMYRDKLGIMWFGTMKDGVFRYDVSRKSFNNFWNNSLTKLLQKNQLGPSVISLHKDESGVLWIGKPDGLLRIDEKTGTAKVFTYNENDIHTISSNTVCTITEESPNILWVGTSFSGIDRFDKTTGKFIRFKHDPKDPKSLSDDNITYVFIDKTGTLWVSTYIGILDKYNPTDNSFIHYRDTLNYPAITTIFEDGSQTMWLGTSIGLAVFDRNSGSYQYFTNNTANPKSLVNNNINTIFEDKYRNLWIGTNAGLDKMNRNNGTFTHFTTGLPNKKIISILEDNNGNLWLLTPRGISNLNPATGLVKNYDEYEGVNLNASFYFPYLKDKNGEMFFGGFNGFIKFHPDSIKDNPFVPSIVITSFKIFNKETKLDSSIILKKMIELVYNENNISFEFASLNFSSSEKNQYAYKMEGVDQDWVYSGTRRFASYPNLDPGEYVFRVKGSNNDGVWNEEGTSITIIISPPFWKTWWAYLLYAGFFIYALSGVRRYEMNRISYKNQVKVDKAVLNEKEETEKIKARFFANISHEFRTPLTLILGPAEKIISDTSDDIKKDANIIKRNSRRLLQLINQLLDLSKLESGKLKLEASKGNIVPFVKGVALSFESLAESKDITLKLLPEKDFIELYFDREKMMKILTNLLSNAFKFTPEEGMVTVSVKSNPPFNSPFTKGGKEGGSVEIKIRDTGIGIPQEEIPKLFDRFYQVDSSFTKEHEGTGIGLALTKELVELHHGNINVESKISDPDNPPTSDGTSWTEFTITIPLGSSHLKDEEIIEKEKTEPPTIPFEQEVYPSSPSKNANDSIAVSINDVIIKDQLEDKTIILIVEDNYDMREYIKESLGNGYRIEEAVNGEQGVRKAQKIIPDLIISDMMMPKMDGNELTRILKNDEKTSHIPIILLTARSGQENKIEGLETGADDYLTKPFDTKELQIRIKNLIALRKKLQEKFSKFDIHPPIAEYKKLSSYDEKFMYKVMEVIDKHISEEDFSIEEFGSDVGMSRTQFHRKFKAITGKPASMFLRSVRLARAKKMIEEQQGNISEIAYSVGFSSPSYFAKCFREEFGYPPSDLVN